MAGNSRPGDEAGVGFRNPRKLQLSLEHRQSRVFSQNKTNTAAATSG
jgi:hypothetical protein